MQERQRRWGERSQKRDYSLVGSIQKRKRSSVLTMFFLVLSLYMCLPGSVLVNGGKEVCHHVQEDTSCTRGSEYISVTFQGRADSLNMFLWVLCYKSCSFIIFTSWKKHNIAKAPPDFHLRPILECSRRRACEGEWKLQLQTKKTT